MKVVVVIGARPQIIKSAPIIHEALKDAAIELQIVHTGQHYDFEMSKIFFGELELPSPAVDLGVGSGSHAWQTGKMMIGLEKTMKKMKPDIVLVPGDTNSTLAGALAAVKLHVPVAHVEAGARSYDMKMPEEVNRRLTDHCSEILCAPTENCVDNLLKEGIPKDQIRFTGDTMYDALLRHMSKSPESRVLERLCLLEGDEYAVLTIHRPENVDAHENLSNILEAIFQLRELAIVFPVHPRTMERLRTAAMVQRVKEAEHVRLVDPVGYHEMLQLVKNAKMVLTDSGGLQKEAFWLHTPCITLRERTEWIETISLKANTLVGNKTDKIVQAAKEYLASEKLKDKLVKMPHLFGDGDAAKKILAALKST